MEKKLHSPYSDSVYMKFFHISSESIQYTWKTYGKDNKFTEEELHQIADGIERSKTNSLYKTHEYLYARPEIDGLTRHYIYDCLELGYPMENHIDLNSTKERIKKVRDAVVRTLYQKNIDEFGPVEKKISDKENIDQEKLKEAENLIKNYIAKEFGEKSVPERLINLKKVPLAYKKTSEFNYNLQVEADLINNRISKYINGNIRYQKSYSNDEFISVLKNLNIEELTYFDETAYRKLETQKAKERKNNNKSRSKEK